MNIKIPNVGTIVLTDKDYLTSGGEAEIYVKDNLAYKIYHDSNKMIPETKIKELSCLSDQSNIIIPKDIIYDEKNKPIGFTMDFKRNVEPLCKLFTNSFKSQHSINKDNVNELIGKIQSHVHHIHDKKILVVDLNELNVLMSDSFDDIFFIDTDSYQTKSHKATAIMASVRDPMIKNNDWNNGSDWFSFAVLAFQSWIGIHPYKGGHPNYKKKDWQKRMEDGVSVFDPDSSVPSMCNDYSVIPPSHYEWLKAVFSHKTRVAPPIISGVSQIIIRDVNIMKSNGIFNKILIHTCQDKIINVYDVLGVKYFICQNSIYKENVKLPINLDNCKKVFLTSTTGTFPVICKFDGKILSFHDLNGNKFSEMEATDVTAYDNRIYSTIGSKFYSHDFKIRNGYNIHSFKEVCSIMETSSKVFDGVVFQSMFKKQFAILPYGESQCSIVNFKELDSKRIISAKFEKNICVVLFESNGQYNRSVFTFNKEFTSYKYREELDVSVGEVNFTVLPNGATILSKESEVEIFAGEAVKIIDNAPFYPTNKLFNKSGTVFYISDHELYQVSMTQG